MIGAPRAAVVIKLSQKRGDWRTGVQCTVFTSHITFVIFMECYTLELHCVIADASAQVQLNDFSFLLAARVCWFECIRLYVSVNTSIYRYVRSFVVLVERINGTI